MNAPFEIVAAPGSEVEDTWRTLRQRPGIVPVLLGERREADEAIQRMKESSQTFEEIKAAGLALDVERWIQQELKGDPDRFDLQEDDEDEDAGDNALPCFTPAYDIRTGEPLKEICFGLIPGESSWLVPAFLKIGGWNDCPHAEVHVAFFRRWFDRYGAEVVTVSDDVIEFHVSRPPRTPEEAKVLAMEQFVYCTDIVDQGVGTLGALTAALVNSPSWYFWWD
ncbi:MAG TPA: DUF4253 domain-containing protein [Steroidobacter sp.]